MARVHDCGSVAAADESVRIFQFIDTRLYIPTRWLGELPERPIEDARGALQPAILASDCPGVVYQVTDGAPLSQRFADIGIDLHAARPQLRVAPAITFILFWKMRQQGDGIREGRVPELAMDRMVDAKDHRSEDSFLRVRPDLAVRLDWRPAGIPGEVWRERASAWRAPARPQSHPPTPAEIGAWGHLVGTAEWNRMAGDVRALVDWLATPPSRRDPNATFTIASA